MAGLDLRFAVVFVPALLALTGCTHAPDAAAPAEGPASKTQVEAYLDEANEAEILDFIDRIRETVGERFLTPDPGVLERHRELTALPRSGVNRILERGPFEGLTPARGGGAYFSFTTLSNDYERSPHLGLDRGILSSGFAGRDCGCIQAIGQAELMTLTADDCPDVLRLEDAFEFCEWTRTVREPAEVAVGRTYVVRSVNWDESDLLVGLTVLDRDDVGATFAWRILEERPKPILGRESSQ